MMRINIFLGALLVLLSLTLIHSQHKARRLFHGLEQANQQAKQLDVERDQFEIEQSRLAGPAQVSRAAQRDLKMEKISPPLTIPVDMGRKTIAAESGSAVKPAAR